MSEPPRDQLGALLLRLREDAGLDQGAAAELAGTSQGSVSRWENGRSTPSMGNVRALLRVYGAGDDDVATAEQLVSDLRGDPNPSARVTMRRGGKLQERIERVEHSSSVIRSFQPVLFHGLTQTEAYARAVFASGGDLSAEVVEENVAVRLRQAAVLDGQHRTVTIVLAPGVLWWPLASAQVMVEQLAHVTEVSRRPNVHIGVVPSTRPVQVAPMHGFDVFDERAAIVGTESATAFLTDPVDVDSYLRLFTDLERAALFGDQARDELRAAHTWYRLRDEP